MRFQMNPATPGFDKKRWVCMAGGFLCMFSLSITWAWSLYVDPMIEIGATDAWMATMYSITMLVAVPFTLIGGWMLDKFGATMTIFSGAISFLVGSILCMFCNHGIYWFAVGVVVMGWGGAVIYTAVYANVAKIFPDKRGTAIAVSGLGISLGGMIVSPVAQWLIETVGLEMQFLIVGIAYTIICLIGLVIFPQPKEGYTPEGYINTYDTEADNGDEKEEGFVQKNWKGMLKDPMAWLLFIMPIIGLNTGMMLQGQLAWMAKDMVMVSAATSAWMLSVVLGASSAGKIVWGFIGDMIGRLKTNTLLYAIMCVCSLILIYVAVKPGEDKMVIFLILTAVLSFAYGGTSSTYPAMVADIFGSKNFGFNFAVMSQSVTLASMISPWIAVIGRLGKGGEADYTMTFVVSAVCAFIAMVLAFVIMKKKTGNIEIVQKVKK